MELFRKKNTVFNNIIWLLFDKGIRILISLFVVGLVARHLEPSSYGIFSFAISISGMLEVFTTLGMRSIIISKFSGVVSYKISHIYLGTSLYLRFLSSLFMVILYVIYDVFFGNNNIYMMIIILSIIFKSSSIISFWFEAKVSSKHIVKIETLNFIIFSCIKIMLVFLNFDLLSFAIAYLLESILLSFMYFWVCNKHIAKISELKFSKKVAKKLISESWPLIISSGAWIIYTRIDLIMISEMLGDYSVGIYSSAVKISDLINILPTVIAFSMLPKLKVLKGGSEYITSFQKVYDITIYITLLLVIVVFLLSDFIITLVFGTDFIEASNILSVYALSSIFISMATVSGRYLVYENLQKITMYRHLLGIIINVPLNYYLIGIFGMLGAAYSTVFSLFISNFIFDFFCENTKVCFFAKAKSLLFFNIFSYLRYK